MHQRRQPDLTTPANDGGAPAAALVLAARWCVRAAATVRADDLDAPSLAIVRRCIVAALADTNRATLDALSLSLARWCERASSDAYDHTALAGLALDAVDAAGACTVAETRDAPVTGDPFA